MGYRKSARVVILNDRGEVLMFRHTGRTRTYWVLPGGGVEPGESWEQAALREMWEETGMEGHALGSLLWTRRTMTTYAGEPVLQDERYYLVRVGLPVYTNANQMADEKRTYTAARWWSLDDMRGTTEALYPERLADLIAPVIAGEPVRWPIALPDDRGCG
jgi:8-oxo-dGTP pyrophosphatase MutT (NUDIX family)